MGALGIEEEDRQTLPAARRLPTSRSERMKLALRDVAAWAWRPFKWLCLAAIAAAFCWGAFLLSEQTQAEERKKQAARVADCARFDNVRLDGILRLRSYERAYGEGKSRNFARGWTVYRRTPNSAEIDVHDNGCASRLVADVPKGQSMWALQSSWMRGEICDCSIVYHIRSMDDPAISTAERDTIE